MLLSGDRRTSAGIPLSATMPWSELTATSALIVLSVLARKSRESYVGTAPQFHMSYAGDSVIGARCSFGAGTSTANLAFRYQKHQSQNRRFDG